MADGFGIDIGGGSVQLMQLEDRALVEAESVDAVAEALRRAGWLQA